MNVNVEEITDQFTIDGESLEEINYKYISLLDKVSRYLDNSDFAVKKGISELLEEMVRFIKKYPYKLSVEFTKIYGKLCVLYGCKSSDVQLQNEIILLKDSNNTYCNTIENLESNINCLRSELNKYKTNTLSSRIKQLTKKNKEIRISLTEKSNLKIKELQQENNKLKLLLSENIKIIREKNDTISVTNTCLNYYRNKVNELETKLQGDSEDVD